MRMRRHPKHSVSATVCGESVSYEALPVCQELGAIRRLLSGTAPSSLGGKNAVTDLVLTGEVWRRILRGVDTGTSVGPSHPSGESRPAK